MYVLNLNYPSTEDNVNVDDDDDDDDWKIVKNNFLTELLSS